MRGEPRKGSSSTPDATTYNELVRQAQKSKISRRQPTEVRSYPGNGKVSATPFVKWVGGKRSIIAELAKRLPAEYDGYYEPFVGGGALFFYVQPDRAYLSDANHRLAMAYRTIKNQVDEVIGNLKAHKKAHESEHCKEYFLEARTRLGTETDDAKVAALLIYLNKTCFNGLYRVNKSGKFNVPIGDYKNPQIVDEQNLHHVSKALKNAEIQDHDFGQTPIKAGAFYYLDPPYHKTYSSYARNGFGDTEHKRLADFCHKLHSAGAYFMLSNSNTEFIRDLYSDPDYHIETVAALRSVSCKAHQRGREDECIIRNYS